ncbi:MAG: PDGLE domain-containing protein [Nitrososphaerales archaeon]
MRENRMILIGIIISVIFVLIGCIYLSSSQETLDKVAEEFGLSESLLWEAPLPDYELRGLEGNLFINLAIGIISTFVIFALTFTIGKILREKKEYVK